MQVIFWKTTPTGSEAMGSIIFKAGVLNIDPTVDVYAQDMLKGVDRSAPGQIERVMRAAPQRYDGHYLRAEFVNE